MGGVEALKKRTVLARRSWKEKGCCTTNNENARRMVLHERKGSSGYRKKERTKRDNMLVPGKDALRLAEFFN